MTPKDSDPDMDKPLPVAGYTAQPKWKSVLVNENKFMEERVLRQLDTMAQMEGIDPRLLAIGRTSVQTAFMYINRAVFQPERVVLPEDRGQPQ